MRFDLLEHAAGAGQHVDLGVLAAHVGLHPARVHGQHAEVGALLFDDEAVDHRVQGRLAGFVQADLTAVRDGYAAQDRAHEGQHAAALAHLADQAAGDADGGHCVGHEQVADVLVADGLQVLWQGAHDARVDEHQVEHLALQALLQAIELSGVVHLQLLDAYTGNVGQGPGLVWVAHGGDDVPAILLQALHQPQAKAA
ncbi:hypothetical protein D3C81_1111940 [compost metagenome]